LPRVTKYSQAKLTITLGSGRTVGTPDSYSDWRLATVAMITWS